ncbi:hypothetical protein ACTWPB_22385 [Nocardia sp. IBHARD005]|uniref:hypothetical protein n=1 Tax=Nocardia sp. IBHARD005 TaxID=3457765 RepID=UPI0040595C5F
MFDRWRGRRSGAADAARQTAAADRAETADGNPTDATIVIASRDPVDGPTMTVLAIRREIAGVADMEKLRSSDSSTTATLVITNRKTVGDAGAVRKLLVAGFPTMVTSRETTGNIASALDTIGAERGFLSSGEADAQTVQIGHWLDAAGGVELMRAVHASVRHGSRLLEVAWDGIGDWRG